MQAVLVWWSAEQPLEPDALKYSPAILAAFLSFVVFVLFLSLRRQESGGSPAGPKVERRRLLPDVVAHQQAERIGGIGSWYWDLAKDEIVWSDEACRILGLTQEQAIPTWSGFLEFVHPDDRSNMDRWFRVSWKTDVESVTECRIKLPNGTVRWVEARVGPFFDEGKKTAVFGTLMDVTERVESLQQIRYLNARQEELVARRTFELREEIAKREAIQSELELSEVRHRAIVDGAADAIIGISTSGLILSANKAVEKVFGHLPEQMIGQPVTILMDPSMAERHQGLIDRYLETGVSSIIGTSVEVEGRRSDGTKFPIELSVSEIKAGDHHFFSAIIRDITDRKAVEQKIRRGEERLREILEFCPMGVSIFAADGDRRLFMNRRTAIQNGFENLNEASEASIGSTFIGGEVPEMLRKPGALGAEIADFEIERVRKDGSHWWSLVSARRVEFDGEDAVIAWQSDITKRKQVEAELLQKETQLRSTINNAPAGIILTDADLKIVVANDQMREIIDVPAEMMLPGRDYSEVIRFVGERGDYGGDTEKGIERVLDTLRNPTAGMFEYESPSSGKIFQVRRHPVAGGGAVTIIMDTSEQKENEERLRQALYNLELAQDELVQSEKMASLGGLVAGVAHEINTPVGTGLTAATHVREETIGIRKAIESNQLKRSDLAKYLETADEGTTIIESNLRRAAALISSFKQVAVDQSSEERRTFTVDTYLRETVSSLTPQFKSNQKVELDLDLDADVAIDSYPGAFSQIVSNLVVNALTHAFEPGVPGRIQIRTTVLGDQVKLTFEDDGKGMNSDVRDKIFEPFFTTRRGSGGSGLGMHIVYNLVTTRLSGTIRCFSNPGEGTRFDIAIPLNPETHNDR